MNDILHNNADHPAVQVQTRTKEEIERWLVRWLSETVGPDLVRTIDPGEPFSSYGLDSLAAVMLSEQVSDWLGWTVPVLSVFDYPCPAELAAFLASPTTPNLATNPHPTPNATGHR
jgi:acyl carrier protein